jgi:hypothetical protein
MAFTRHGAAASDGNVLIEKTGAAGACASGQPDRHAECGPDDHSMCCLHIALLGEVTVTILSRIRWLVLVLLAGCEKTISAQQNLDGPQRVN